MRRWVLGLAALTVCLACSGDSEAGLFRHRARRCRPTACASATASVTTTATAYGSPVPIPQTYYGGSDAGAFLQSLNAWRALHGRPPAVWDSGLAAWAATNTGVHAPGSSGGGSQAWASAGSLTVALSQWVASPAHASILLGASVVGASPCPSGVTCNGR